PRRNRITPFGDIIATTERGTCMGNRGVLHDAAGAIQRAWTVKRWIVCVLEFRGRQRKVMTPGRYTELFFLDEATALAAGHRPCAECRHQRFLDFCQAWKLGNTKSRKAPRPTADEMDNCLHGERLACGNRPVTALLDPLPDGVFITLEPQSEQAWLVWGKA